MSYNSGSSAGQSYQGWMELLESKSFTPQSGNQTGTEKSDTDTASDMDVHLPSSPRSERETPDMFELLVSTANLLPFSPSDEEGDMKKFEWTSFVKELRVLGQGYQDNSYYRYVTESDFLNQELHPSFNRTGPERKLVSVLFHIFVIAQEENETSITDSDQEERHANMDAEITKNAAGVDPLTIEGCFGQGAPPNVEKCINQKQDGGWLRFKQSMLIPGTGKPCDFYMYYGLYDPTQITQ